MLPAMSAMILTYFGVCIDYLLFIDGFSHIIWLNIYKTSSDLKGIVAYFVKVLDVLSSCPRHVETT